LIGGWSSERRAGQEPFVPECVGGFLAWFVFGDWRSMLCFRVIRPSCTRLGLWAGFISDSKPRWVGALLRSTVTRP